MVKFIVDTQLPPLLAKFLTEHGYDALHTTNYLPDGHLLQDNEIVKIAVAENRIIVTKDNDFLDNYLLKGVPPKLLLIKLGNITNRSLIQIIELNLQQIVTQFEIQAEVIILTKNQLITY